MSRPTVDELIAGQKYELLAELEHKEVKQFILKQLSPSIALVRFYSVYQVLMLLLVLALFGFAVTRAFSGQVGYIQEMAWAVLFSLTVLVVLHEAFHALAYRICGIRNLRAGAIWKKFIFYVAADREVVDYSIFRFVAYAPFVLVKFSCLVAILLTWAGPGVWFFASVMCIHSLFCAGDMALLAFYKAHEGKTIFNYDDLRVGKTYFYFQKG